MNDLGDVFIFFVFIAFVMLWWNAQGVKQIALKSTQAHCEKMGVQLLDEGVALRGFWVKRNKQGSVRIWRSYNFEFTSTGDERYAGQIILLGDRVESVQLDPHRLN